MLDHKIPGYYFFISFLGCGTIHAMEDGLHGDGDSVWFSATYKFGLDVV